MRYLLPLILLILILPGCQGEPRFGGGYHDREGQYEAEKKQEKATGYGVDPLKMGEIIDRYLGKPYAGQSESQRGYDCSGFVVAVYEEYASMHLPRTTDKLFSAGREVERGDLYFGDLVFFDTGGRGVSHVGIYVGFDEFAHASTSNGIIISSLQDDYYHKRYRGARRVME